MNTIGVTLSACCLLVSLVELRMRSDLAGRRMAAILASAAWATMGFVALDQSRQCAMIMRKQSAITVPAKQIIADALQSKFQYDRLDKVDITRESPAQAQSALKNSQPQNNMISSRINADVWVGAEPD